MQQCTELQQLPPCSWHRVVKEISLFPCVRQYNVLSLELAAARLLAFVSSTLDGAVAVLLTTPWAGQQQQAGQAREMWPEGQNCPSLWPLAFFDALARVRCNSDDSYADGPSVEVFGLRRSVSLPELPAAAYQGFARAASGRFREYMWLTGGVRACEYGNECGTHV